LWLLRRRGEVLLLLFELRGVPFGVPRGVPREALRPL